MTSGTSATPSPPAAPQAPRRGIDFVWRVMATLVIVAAAIVAAQFLGNPNRLAPPEKSVAAKASASVPGQEAEAAPEAPMTPEQKGRSLQDSLRQTFEGLLVRMAGEHTPADDQEDPGRMKPEERRRFLAERFHLPYDYPHSEVTPGLLPPGVEAMMVFEHPEAKATRMVLVRAPMKLEKAMQAFQTFYVKAGWEASAPEANKRTDGPPSTMDNGWMIRYARGKQVRFVFLRPRGEREETLGVVYDSPN